MKSSLTIYLIFFLPPILLQAQLIEVYKDSLVVSNKYSKVIVNVKTGKVNYRFESGGSITNSVVYIDDIHVGKITATDFNQHLTTTKGILDNTGKGVEITIKHIDKSHQLFLLQHIILYNVQPYLLLDVQAKNKPNNNFQLETRNISPFAILPSQNGKLFVPGKESRILDMPFDNDNWVHVLERKWTEENRTVVSGISYEMSSVYDNTTLNGIVVGSITHDFWKTGISYQAGNNLGNIDKAAI